MASCRICQGVRIHYDYGLYKKTACKIFGVSELSSGVVRFARTFAGCRPILKLDIFSVVDVPGVDFDCKAGVSAWFLVLDGHHQHPQPADGHTGGPVGDDPCWGQPGGQSVVSAACRSAGLPAHPDIPAAEGTTPSPATFSSARASAPVQSRIKLQWSQTPAQLLIACCVGGGRSSGFVTSSYTTLWRHRDLLQTPATQPDDACSASLQLFGNKYKAHASGARQPILNRAKDSAATNYNHGCKTFVPEWPRCWTSLFCLKLKFKTRSYESKRDEDPDSEETRVALRALKRSR